MITIMIIVIIIIIITISVSSTTTRPMLTAAGWAAMERSAEPAPRGPR